MNVNDTLKERENSHGDFSPQATLSQYLKTACRDSGKWSKLPPDQREAIEMICMKISRILHGDNNFADSWHDIAGYAILIEKKLSRGNTRR